MRLPPPPPKSSKSQGNIPVVGPEVRGRYVSWDDLRWIEPPSGFSREAWWRGLTEARRPMFAELPLRDVEGRTFRHAATNSVLRLLHRIDRTGSGRVELPAQVTTAGTRDRYLVSSLTEEAIRSSQLEGAVTTREIAKEMLRTGRPPIDRSERMIANNYAAMELVRRNVLRPLDTAFVLELHAVIADGALEGASDGAGRFRTADEQIQIVGADGEVHHVPPPAEQLPRRVEEMCRFATTDTGDEFVHPLVKAIALHFWLAYDHPFVDGNGRTARALFYWAMLREGYWLTEFISISRLLRLAPAQYSRAFLLTETYDNDLTYFLLHQLDILERAIADLFAYLGRKSQELRQVETVAKRRTDLNDRQLALLGHALRHPGWTYTIQGHQRSHAIVYDTARRDLLELSEKGLLSVGKSRRAFVFHPMPDLDRLLKTRPTRR